MSKAKIWRQEVLNKARTGEFLKYRQVNSLLMSLKQIKTDLQSLIKSEKGNKEAEKESVSEELVEEVTDAIDGIVVHEHLLSELLESYGKKRNKLKFSDKDYCYELHKDMTTAIDILDRNNLVSIDRLIFLRELNQVFNKEYLVSFDLEMTCDPDREHMRSETLEIGVVVFDTRNLKEVGRFESMVKPTLHPVLTSFIMNLTGIKQNEADIADTFDVVAEKLRDFLSPYQNKAVALQWGEGDMRQINHDCKLHGIDNPFGTIKSYNMKKAYGKLYYRTGSTGLVRASEIFNLERHGTAHRALSDAELTLSIVKCMHHDWRPEFKKIVLQNTRETSKNRKHNTYF